jgi:membrane associated rhomboid family serine protease
MIPLKDYNPTRRRALLTAGLIIACVAVYFGVQPAGRSGSFRASVSGATCADYEFNLREAAIPYEIIHGRPLTEPQAELLVSEAGCPVTHLEANPHKSVWLSILVSMFLHGGLLHLGGNMLFLWVFGNNIEDRLGRLRYLLFYLAAGLVATFAQVALDPQSVAPMIGASGAIAGVMGAYLVLYPRVRIRSLLIIVIIPLLTNIPAWLLLGFWFVSQFFVNASSGVAWAAHVGGFAFGAALGLVLRNRESTVGGTGLRGRTGRAPGW